MNSSNYSTKNPIVLVVGVGRDSDLVDDILSQSCSLKKINDTLNICVNKTSLPVPDQYSDALHLIIHHLDVYQRTARSLMESSVTLSSLAVYIAVTHYYCEVILAFCKEIEDDVPGSNKTWRSAHLDYHFALALENNAFTKEMQKAALSKIKRTWTDFKRKKAYGPVSQLNIAKYHQKLCNGKNMCGDTTADHKMSVEDTIAEILQTSLSSTPMEVDPEKREKVVRFDAAAAEPKKSTKRTTVRKVKMTVRPVESETSSHTALEVEEDDIDETAHMFEMKEDGRKPRKSVKGGRLQKEARGSVLRESTPDIQKSRANRATRNIHKQGKRMGTGDTESEESEAEDKNANKTGTRPSMHGTDGRRVGETNIRSSTESREPTRAARVATTYGQRRTIMESDVEDGNSNDAARGTSEIYVRAANRTGTRRAIVESDVEEERSNDAGRGADMVDSNECTQPITGVPEPTLSESNATTQMDVESSPKQSNASVVEGNENDTSDGLLGYTDDDLPSTLHDWEDWHRVAFRKGNSHMFLKLGTWILLRFRQLAKVPMDEDPDGLLIPDHPANFEMDFDADFREALGMTRLYSALAHIDTHPEYLAHIFHEIGKASEAEQLGNSHPGFRPLPELPVPVKSMVAMKHWPFSRTDESDADGDGDGDGDDEEQNVAGALNDMLISGARMSAPVVTAEEHDLHKRKRRISSTLSPPKADGGRGSSKRPKNTSGHVFVRYSSPITTSIEGVVSQPDHTETNTIEAASLSRPSTSQVTHDCGMETHADPILAPRLTQAIQHKDSTGDRTDGSNMTISSRSNSQDAEEHVTDPGTDASLSRIDFMHVDELLDDTQRTIPVDDDIMDYSDIMEGSDMIEGSEDMDGGDVAEGNGKSLDRLSRAKDEDVRVLVQSTPE